VTSDKDQFVDWEWLGSFHPVEVATYLRHIRFDPAVALKLDGLKGVAVLVKGLDHKDRIPQNRIV